MASGSVRRVTLERIPTRSRRGATPEGLSEDIAPRRLPLPDAAEDPLWFQRAVFYEVFIRGYFDGNNDGVGDIPGLIAKLDYLEWLGVDCIWLLPFYPSPLRDGGYDISDYFSVHPESGTVEDLSMLLEEAHARGIRVIADLVINHTSDEHPWFIESRQSRDNPKADWYVWNDDDQRWPEARVVFIDVERSNWAWDPIREQYYWHRFYSHQPDLNYENPEVAEAMLDVVRFWLDLGLDGFRLDAVPFLFQKDGTAGENLPETHAFIRRAGGRPMWPTTSATTTSATCASTSPSCPGCSWPSGGSRAIPSPRSWPRPPRPRATLSGPSSCATTTS